VDATWRALADPTRRRLIELLRDGPRTTGDLCQAFATSRFAVMKHLDVLEQAGLVAVRREGRLRWNELRFEPLQQVSERWAGSASGSDPGSREVSMVVADQPPRPAAAMEVFIDAVRWRVFDAITVNVGAWWGAPHLRSEDASNLLLEPQPGGRFYEEWGHRQGALRAVVTAIRQDERLDLAGPIFNEGVDVRLSFRLEPREGGTLLTVTSSGAAAQTIDDLFHVRLKAFVENGVGSGT